MMRILITLCMAPLLWLSSSSLPRILAVLFILPILFLTGVATIGFAFGDFQTEPGFPLWIIMLVMFLIAAGLLFYTLRSGHIEAHPTKVSSRIFSFGAGGMLLCVGLGLTAWVGYNLLIERLPATEGRNPLPALLFAVGAIALGYQKVKQACWPVEPVDLTQGFQHVESFQDSAVYAFLCSEIDADDFECSDDEDEEDTDFPAMVVAITESILSNTGVESPSFTFNIHKELRECFEWSVAGREYTLIYDLAGLFTLIVPEDWPEREDAIQQVNADLRGVGAIPHRHTDRLDPANVVTAKPADQS